MDIETMRGEIIDHKRLINSLVAAMERLQDRVTSLENKLVVNQEVPIPRK